MAAIEAVLDRRVLAVEGGAATGKTSLLQAACRRAGTLASRSEKRGSDL